MHANTTGSITLTGEIASLSDTGFTLNGGAGCGYVHVTVDTTTVVTGPKLAAGIYAEVAGTGSCATSIDAATVTTSTTPISSGGLGESITVPKAATVDGPITALLTGGTGFTVNGGAGVGYVHVFTSASTAYAGGTPKVGDYAQSTGSGSPSTSITAAFVSLYASAPASMTVSGVVASPAPYGFVFNGGGANAALPVITNASTVVGGSPLVTGASVKVTGTGAAGVSLLATSIVVYPPSPAPGNSPSPTPSPIAQKHLLTADYLGTPYGTTTVAYSAAAPYLSWAQTGTADANAIHAAGILTQYYADPNRTSAGMGDPLYTSDETTFAHDCSGNRVTDMYNTIEQYVMDIGGSSMQALFASHIAQAASLGHFDAVFEDDAGPLSEFVYSPFSAMPCSYSDTAWLTDGEAINQVSSVPIIFNGLNELDGEQPSMSLGLLATSNTIGGNFEHCYSDDSQAEMTGWSWQAIENSELQVASQHKLFECQLRNSASAASSSAARIYALASFLLTYDPTTSILWEEFATTSGLHVEPESQLVALDPLAAAPSNVSALELTGGAYGRQYAQCFIAGAFAGPCAVVVNASTSAAPFPYPQYAHALTLSGGGIIDGGTMTTTGTAPATLAVGQAAIVFP